MDCGGALAGRDHHGGDARGPARTLGAASKASTLASWRNGAQAQRLHCATRRMPGPPHRPRAKIERASELERELLRKDRALSETAALLVLSKKVTAIFNRSEDA